MKFMIKVFSEQRFAYMRRVGAYGKENCKLMATFKKWARDNDYFSDTTVVYGIARDDARVVSPASCRYDVGMIVDEDFENKEVNIDVILAGKYVVFTIKHTADTVQNFWDSLFTILEKENFQFDKHRFRSCIQ